MRSSDYLLKGKNGVVRGIPKVTLGGETEVMLKRVGIVPAG